MTTPLNRMAKTIAAAMLLSVASAAMAQDKQTIRPEVGTPLQEAQKQLQSKNFKGALTKIGEAEQVGKLTPYEQYLIYRLRAAAAAGSGDSVTALKSFEAALASGQVPKEEQLLLIETIAKVAYSAKNYSKASEYIDKYKAAGGNKPDVISLEGQALYLAGRYPEAAREIGAQVAAVEKAGQTPPEQMLQLLASCALKQNDMNAYVGSLERLATYYPKDSYWLDLILRTANKPGFADRLSLDVYRLRYATGTLEKAGDYMEAAQLALQAGLPGEAQKYVDAGYKAKVLGDGPDAERHTRLKSLIAKNVTDDKAVLASADKQAAAAPTGDPLVNTGLNYVAYGDFAKGLDLMKQGIAKGQLKRADDSKLHYGYAQLLAGEKADATATLRGVGGTDGTKDLARLWSIAARHSLKSEDSAAAK